MQPAPRRLSLFLLVTLLFAGTAAAQTPVAPLVPVAQVTHPPITEMSGIAKSHRFKNTYWVQNDSGDTARVFAVRGDGSVITPPSFAGKDTYPGIPLTGATNVDWEEVTLDGNTLYVADTGNNKNARRDLCVYALSEPNPEKIDSATVLKRFAVAYPDQTAFPPLGDHNFDCEAIFALRGKLYFLTKWRTGGKLPGMGTALYRMDTRYTDRVNVLTKLETKPDMGGWVTACSVSPDGKTLAVLCQAPVPSVWLFALSGAKNDRFLSQPARRLLLSGAKQCEAVCFDDAQTLRIGNEERDLFLLKIADFKPVTH